MTWLPRPAEGLAHVAPSLLSADFGDLRGEIESMTAAGAGLLHLDVMDGHFVPNITFGPFICAAIRRLTDLPLDAHLMISRPDLFLEPFVKSGVDGITIHVEAESDVAATLGTIGKLGVKRGISLNPDTPLSAIEPYLPQLDLILVMTVQPGFGGQSFNESGLEKISELARRREASGHGYLISVDGGINAETGPMCRQAGADILVSGSWLFNAEDRAAHARHLGGVSP